MVKIRLENRFPNIIGLEDWERPLQLLEDIDKILYLVISWDYSTNRPKNCPINRVFIGNENEEMNSVDRVIKLETYRDGWTTEVEFVKDSEKGEIHIPSSFNKRSQSILRFKGQQKELKKVGYTCPYLFNVWRKPDDS